MSQMKIPPAAVVVLVLIALLGVGFVGMKIIKGGSGEASPVIVAKPDPNDPHFQQRLPNGMSGGGT